MLRAVQAVLDEGLAKPILIGRREVVETRIERLGLRMKPGRDFELRQSRDPTRAIREYWKLYHRAHGAARRLAGRGAHRRAHAQHA